MEFYGFYLNLQVRMFPTTWRTEAGLFTGRQTWRLNPTYSRGVIGETRLQRQVRDWLGPSRAGRWQNDAGECRLPQKTIWLWVSQGPENKHRFDCQTSRRCGWLPGGAARSGKPDGQLWHRAHSSIDLTVLSFRLQKAAADWQIKPITV